MTKFVYRSKQTKKDFAGTRADLVVRTLKEQGLEPARAAFEKVFGIPYTDPSIGLKFRDIIEDWSRSEQEGGVVVPPRVAVAMPLRKGLGGRKRGPVPKADARSYNDAVDQHDMRTRKAEITKTTPRERAASIGEKVVEEFSEPGRTRHSKSGIRRRLERRRA